jgi:hypothetical protein
VAALEHGFGNQMALYAGHSPRELGSQHVDLMGANPRKRSRGISRNIVGRRGTFAPMATGAVLGNAHLNNAVDMEGRSNDGQFQHWVIWG